MTTLPKGWAQSSLGELASYVTSGSRDWSKYYASSGALFVRTENINRNRLAPLDEIAHVDLPDSVEGKRTLIQRDDLLITITGANVGKCAHVSDELPEAYVSQSVALVRLLDPSLACFIHKQLIAPGPEGDRTLLQESAYGLGRPVLNLNNVRSVPIRIAPLAEQRRIAEKLDDLLARVDACRDRIDRIPSILKRFRHAVLAAAINGELTRNWREERGVQHPWRNCRLEELGTLGRGKSKHRPRNDERLYGGPYPFIQTGDVAQSGGVIERHSQTYSEFGLAQSKLWPTHTVCITIAANIADTATLSYPACFPDSVVGFVADSTKAVPEFVKWSIDVIRSDLESFAPATAQKNINLAVLNKISIACPDLEEQQEIVRRVLALLEVASTVEAGYQEGLERVERLTSSVLAKAFKGELVPQAPNDEPASVLLERIRRERAEAVPPTVKRGRKPRGLSGVTS